MAVRRNRRCAQTVQAYTVLPSTFPSLLAGVGVGTSVGSGSQAKASPFADPDERPATDIDLRVGDHPNPQRRGFRRPVPCTFSFADPGTAPVGVTRKADFLTIGVRSSESAPSFNVVRKLNSLLGGSVRADNQSL